jgi:hypothetical protein
MQLSMNKCTKITHTHALYNLEGHHTEDEGSSHQWGAGRHPHPAAQCHPVSEPPHSSSHARKHNEDQSYALIYGGFIQGKIRDVTRIDDMAVE